GKGVDLYKLATFTLSGVQALNLRLEDLATSTPAVGNEPFVSAFFSNLFARLTQWFADAANGVGDFFANRVRTKELCVSDGAGETCVTRTQLDALLASAAGASGGGGAGAATGTGGTATTTDVGGDTSTGGVTSDTEAPVITLNGNNPATVNVGDIYTDLGASVTDNVNNNLGYTISLNGATSTDPSSLFLDTGISSTNTLTFFATDQAGNTGTATRTVLVEDPASTTSTATSTTP
ncbi:MAG: immunoglobulin-like domain-containing protein, partial [Patescibacteria group bacterium]